VKRRSRQLCILSVHADVCRHIGQPKGHLYVVTESHLLDTSGKVRRVYRGAAVPQKHMITAVGPEVREMSPDERQQVRRQLGASQPLKQSYFATTLSAARWMRGASHTSSNGPTASGPLREDPDDNENVDHRRRR
jgi:hypothetical protein